MSAGLLRFSSFGLVFVVVTGCGGGSAGGSGGGGGGTATTVTFTFQGGAPAAVATQTGSGSFAAATVTSGKATLEVPSGTSKFAVAWVCAPLSETIGTGQLQLTNEYVMEASTADGTSFALPCPSSPSQGQTGTLTGSVDASAIPGASYLNIAAQNGSAITEGYSATPTANFSFAAPTGSDRVEVLAYSTAINGPIGPFQLVGARNFTGQAVPGALNGGNAVVLGAGDQTTLQAITYNNVPSGYSAPNTLVSYEMGGVGGFLVADSAATNYPVLPSSAVESGDFYLFVSSAGANANPGAIVEVGTTSSTGGPVSLTFPTPWTYAGPTPAALPAFDLNYTGYSGKSGVTQVATVGWLSGSLAQSEVLSEVFIFATSNHQAGSTSLTIPDLSGLTGFLPSPLSGTTVEWTAEIEQSSYVIPGNPPANANWSFVANSGGYSVP